MGTKLVRHGISVGEGFLLPLQMSPAKPSEYIEDKKHQIELIVLYLSNPKIIIFTINKVYCIGLPEMSSSREIWLKE